MKDPLISIVIVNWNGQKWLDQCLSSLVRQTYRSYEIILVDNSSTDDSVSFTQKNYPAVIILNSENKGYGHACNLGAKEAKGQFIMFFNEDMHVDADFLEKYLTYYQSVEDKDHLGTIGCSISDYDKSKSGSSGAYGMAIDIMGTPTPNAKPETIFHNSGCPFFISRQLFLNTGGFCPNIFLYSEDLDLCWRLNLYGYRHYYASDIHIYHYGGGVVGGFSPEKLSYYIRGELNSILNNYSSVMLPFALIYFSIFYILLAASYFFRGKTSYSKKVYSSIFNEIRYNLKDIISFRRIVQSRRKVTDWELMKRINIIPSRLRNLKYNRAEQS